MSKLVEKIVESGDHVLDELAKFAPTISDTVERSEDHAMLVLGVKYIDENSPDGEGVQTYISAAGYYGILAEGLYAELSDQISKGHMSLFSILRDVVRDIEADLGIDPNMEMEEKDGTTYH